MIDRRGFLIGGTQAAVGLSLLGADSVRAQERSPRTLFLEKRIAEWDKGIPVWLRDARLPGASMVIIDAGKIMWEGQFGLKDAGAGESVRRDTVFAACSNTKPVFAYAVVKLCEKGVMDLDYLRPHFKRDEITSSGLGWVIGQFGALTVFTHAGSAPGWQCESFASVGRKAGIIIMTDVDNFLPFREQLKLDLDFFTQLFAV